MECVSHSYLYVIYVTVKVDTVSSKCADLPPRLGSVHSTNIYNLQFYKIKTLIHSWYLKNIKRGFFPTFAKSLVSGIQMIFRVTSLNTHI